MSARISWSADFDTFPGAVCVRKSERWRIIFHQQLNVPDELSKLRRAMVQLRCTGEEPFYNFISSRPLEINEWFLLYWASFCKLCNCCTSSTLLKQQAYIKCSIRAFLCCIKVYDAITFEFERTARWPSGKPSGRELISEISSGRLTARGLIQIVQWLVWTIFSWGTTTPSIVTQGR